jgi:replicative DNA helicase
MFIEHSEKDPEDDSGSAYTRTVDGDAAAQNYNFESVTTDEAPIPEPPMPGNDDAPPENDDFFAQANDSFPDGF